MRKAPESTPTSLIKLLWSVYSRSSPAARRVIGHIAKGIGPLYALVSGPVSVLTVKMKLDFSDNASFRYLRYGSEYEADLANVLLRAISQFPHGIFIDVGASYGFYTLVAGGIGRHGLLSKILSFEPDARCVGALHSSIRLNGLQDLVTVSQGLVGDYEGEADFLHSLQGSTSNRSFGTSEGYFRSKAIQRRPVTTLDAEIRRHGIECGDAHVVVKIDVEGNELRVIRGMKFLLQCAASLVVLIEYFPVAMREVGSSPLDFIQAISATNWDMAGLRVGGEWKIFDSVEALGAQLLQIFQESQFNPRVVADVLLAKGPKPMIETMNSGLL